MSRGRKRLPARGRWRAGAYFDFLTAIKDPTHEEHNSMLQWAGGSFDPVAFNIADANERLATPRASIQ
jgi:hypothetical protein